MAHDIKHIIVLMLENRSFDHMLGFLNHPNPKFPKITSSEFSNSHPKVGTIGVNSNAKYRLKVGPDHSHESITEQVSGPSLGFVANYYKRLTGNKKEVEKKVAVAKANYEFDKEIVELSANSATISRAHKANLKAKLKIHQRKIKAIENELQKLSPEADAGKVMACFSEDRIPVLATLAKEFCVFTHWHSSVPGETWPNRSFAHAATSDGEVDIKGRFYKNRTIFEDMAEAFFGKSEKEQERAWACYHDGPAHLWVYPALRDLKGGNFRQLGRLTREISDPDNPKNPLPRYCFVEPNHGMKLGPIFKKKSQLSNNQHPSNNTSDFRDFLAAEQLIADIYNALKANPALFQKTLFLITYDEHGGFFDHVEPPKTVAPDNKIANFNFKTLGVRVPAVLVSPWVDRGTINKTIRDHSAIPRTVRKIFIGNQKFLTKREEWVSPFDSPGTRTAPRVGTQLPTVNAPTLEEGCEKEGLKEKTVLSAEKREMKNSREFKKDLDTLEKSLLDLTANIEESLVKAEVEGADPFKAEWNPKAGDQAENRFTNSEDLGKYLESVSQSVQKVNL